MTATTFISACWTRGQHDFRAFPARAAGNKINGIPVVIQKRCKDCKVTRSELEDGTVRYWWSQKDGSYIGDG